MPETHEPGMGLSPALVLLGQHDAGGAGQWALGWETRLKQTRASFLLFGGEPENRPKYSASNF